MAEFAEVAPDFSALGVELAALSVDDAPRSHALRERLGLPFPVLCDPGREVVQAWDLYDEKQAGGIARPAVYLIGPGRQVLFSVVGEVHHRVDAQSTLTYLRGGPEPQNRRVRPGLRDVTRILVSAARFGIRTPRS